MLNPTYPIIRPDRTAQYGWYLDEDVVVTMSNGRELFIPKGYRFDGHSVPRLLWVIAPPFGRDIYAALVHDVLYEYNKTIDISRKESDNEYLRLHLSPEYKISPVRSYLMWGAVRAFGWLFFYFNAK